MTSSRRDILLKHYVGLFRKYASVVGVVSLLAMLLPGAAMATGQLTTRSVTLGTSNPGATTTYAFSVKAATATQIKAIQIQLCTSPLDLGTGANCTQPGTGSLAAATLSAQSGGLSGWAMGTGSNAQAPTATNAVLFLSAGLTPTVGQVENFTLSNVVNPSTANYQYYLRVNTWATYNTSSVTTEVDFGGDAVSTGTELTVAANVQESLQFTVGSTNCTTGTGPINVGGGGSSNVLTTGTTTGANSYECVNTNASTGYALSYISSSASAPCPNGGTAGSFTNCTGTTHDFYQTAAATDFNTATGAAPDHDYYGMNLTSNVGGTNGDAAALTGAAPTTGSGIVAPTMTGAYNTTDKFAWAPNAVTTLASENTGPTATETFTSTYEAQAGSLTPAGQYKVNIDYICTSTY